MSEPQPEIIPLEPGARRLGQTESAELHETIHAVPCPDCGAAVDQYCHREGVGGRRYETRLAHPRRIRDAAAKRAQEANAGE